MATPINKSEYTYQKFIKLKLSDSYDDGDKTDETHILAIDAKTLYNIDAKKGELEKLKDIDLRDKLIEMGAKHQDHDGEPAITMYYKGTDQLESIGYFKDGKRNDPEPGTAAYEEYDKETGNAKIRQFYKDGEYCDPQQGVPAKQVLTCKDGYIIEATSYPEGGSGKKLNQDEIVKLNENKNICIALPNSLKKFEM